ncbi:MAG: phosphotransferase [Oscillospiraceae bacterium]
MDQVRIGKFIAERRKERGLLQKDIAAKLGISEKTVSKWECGNGLPEVVYMEPLCRILGITVNELLAGRTIPVMELLSLIDASRLELVRQLELEQLRMRIYKLYDIEIEAMETSANGAGGLTYFVTAGGKRYVVKYPTDNDINHPETEIRVCETLLKKGIPACRFIPDKHGRMLSTDENGRRFTVQHFYEGVTYGYNEAPEELQKASAVMLARIHEAMKDMEDIPVGIGGDFFAHRKPEYMRDSYARALKQAEDNGDNDIACAIRSNIRIIGSMPEYEFDINKFTCGSTHGDYMISQLIWLDGKVNGIIDWTCACRHPYIWEIFRSYVFMAPEVRQGELNTKALLRYIEYYAEYGRLNAYDIENAGKLFCYFLSVCNFYGQYYDSISNNRHIYLKQAEMSSKLLAWFEKHIDELNEGLCGLSDSRPTDRTGGGSEH